MYRIYILPGLVFQSVIIGGGYGSGREMVEFFLSNGPVGALLGTLVVAAIWAISLAITFELARKWRAYEYRTFFRHLIGPGWRLFEMTYILLAVLILSVLASATADVFSKGLRLPAWMGILLLIGATTVIVATGNRIVARAFATWSVALYSGYLVLVVLALGVLGDDITLAIQSGGIGSAWALDATQYAAYTLAAIAPVLFSVEFIKTRRQAVVSGIAAGVLGTLPASMIILAMVSVYPAVLEEPIPIMHLLNALDIQWFSLVFQIILVGTFIETAVGIIHAFNERLFPKASDQKVSRPKVRALLCLAIMGFSVYIAGRFGIIDLIAKGYGTIAYILVALVVVPLLSRGLWLAFAGRAAENLVSVREVK
jgi:uncharacterized membrane protein YkvI